MVASETNHLFGDGLQLRDQAWTLKSQIDNMQKAQEEVRKQSVASGNQFTQIMAMSSKLQVQTVTDAKKWKVEREEWAEERKRLMERINKLECDGITGHGLKDEADDTPGVDNQSPNKAGFAVIPQVKGLNMKLTLQDRLLRRELGDPYRYSSIKGIYGDKTWVEDLDVVNELGGHDGCVNALSWSKSGRLLASGSDDTNLNIHSYHPENSTVPFALTASVATGHTANIFSVKFMPHSNDSTLVTCAGDGEVRVFDIEYAGRGAGVQYLHDKNTNARVYRSHGDRVKRIVTESSPHLFLSCSEDGEVRQWDLRLPSSAYPRPRGGRGFTSYRSQHDDSNIPPPLISYRRYRLDLNTISCSASQPHYIVLGGAHLHCFLHDRRMLGRDVESERGSPNIFANEMSELDDELMGQATRCVRRFAPHGKKKMLRTDNGHVTACKISDTNPNEMIASWSGDNIYSFNLIKSPDVMGGAVSADVTISSERKKRKTKESQDRKRKRKQGDSSTSIEGMARGVSRLRQTGHLGDEGGDLALRVRYENGQSEDISIRATVLEATVEEARAAVLTESHKRSLRIAKSVVKIRKHMFSLEGSTGGENEPSGGLQSNRASFTSVLGFSAAYLPEMDDIIRTWSYPVDPSAEMTTFQRALRSNRDSSRRFVQASGTLARLLGGSLQTAVDEEITASLLFDGIKSAPLEGPFLDTGQIFCYDFLKAICLWFDGGLEGLLKGFMKSKQRGNNDRHPVPEDADVSGIHAYLIPYLLGLAQRRPIPNIDVSRFERDEYRIAFENESAAVISLSHAVRIPFADLSNVVAVDNSGLTAQSQDRQTALKYWGFKIGRGVLMNAGEGVNFAFVERAFGGLGIHREVDEGRAQEDINLDEPEDESVAIVGHSEPNSNSGVGQAEESALLDTDNPDGLDNLTDMETGPMIIDMLPDVFHNPSVNDDPTDGYQEEEQEQEEDEEEGEEDEDDGSVEDDSSIDYDPQAVYMSGSTGDLRERVEINVPCDTHTGEYRGHCNFRTVKDVNYFGLQDEYVVSGSDSGHLFIWDAKTSQLLNILQGDGEVVNVAQGHPYEPLLAVSGIDHTIKILSPNLRDQVLARNGINIGKATNRSHGTSYIGRRRRQATAQPQPAHPNEANTWSSSNEPRSDPTFPDTEPETDPSLLAPVPPHGLPSCRRMHDSYRITSQNDIDRQGGIREDFITRGMLAQLAAHIRARRAAAGEAGDANGDGGEGEMLVLDENCMVM